MVGFVFNLYVIYVYFENVLVNYFNLFNVKIFLFNKEKEVVNLIVSEVNDC